MAVTVAILAFKENFSIFTTFRVEFPENIKFGLTLKHEPMEMKFFLCK